MKKLFAWALAPILALGILLSTGCKTTPTGGNALDVDKSAIALKTATWGALTVVIQKNPTNAPPYIRLASTTLTEFIGGTNYAPGALQLAIQGLPSNSLKKPEVQYAIMSVTMAYELAYATFVQGQVGGNENAFKLLSGIRDGCDAALAGALK